MKSTDIFEAIGGAKDRYLSSSEKHRKSVPSYMGWIACAACFCVAIVCFTLLRTNSPDISITPSPTIPESLQTISLPSEFGVNGMGYEGYTKQDINEIKNAYPWNVDEIPETLPVFNNKSYNPYISSYGQTEREMLSIVYDVLDFFKIQISDKNFTGIKKQLFTESNRDPRGFLIPDDTITKIELTVEFGKIELWADGTLTIWFDKIPTIPSEYNINVNSEETLLYCAEMFRGLLKFENPTIADGNIIYDGAGDIQDQILNYSFEYAKFYFDADGNISTLRIYNDLSVAEKLGDYPTISKDKAQELLLEGIYVTNYIETEFPGDEYIAHVTLAYRSSYMDKTWLPYYKFYVEIPEKEAEDGTKTYAVYYVPAIEPEYITSYPDADIEFTDKPVVYPPYAPKDFPELS